MARPITHLFLFATVMLLLAGCRQPLVIHVTDLPDNTPLQDPLYITGNFNNWNPGDPTYQLLRDAEGGARIEIPRGLGELEFKFTRGTWAKEEVDSCGNKISNRRISNLELNDVKVQIDQWYDLSQVFCDGVELYIRVPESTPIPNEIYLSGDFNGWALADPKYRATHLGGQIYRISLPKDVANSEYKINRGTWNTVEVSTEGSDIENRRLSERIVQRVVIENWKDACLQDHPYRYLLLKDWPDNTPAGSTFFFASNINGWNPGDFAYRFQPIEGGYRIIRIPNSPDPIEFKITRGGNWSTVEVGPEGGEIKNRVLEFGIEDTIPIVVHNWKDRVH